MNIFKGKPIRLLTTIFSMLVSIAMLNACGSSGGSGGSDTTAGIGGTGIALGKVTDFGSIFVNGSIFDINQAQFLVDGEEKVGQAGQDDLSVGMVVLVKAETNNGVFTGKALEVFYDDEVEGPVTSVTPDPMDANLKIITVFGQTITLDDTNTLFKDTSVTPDPNYGFATIAVNDVIEVSGFRVSPTEITATYVEKTDDLNPGASEVELRGPIKNLTGIAPNQAFMVDSTNITTNLGTFLEVPGGVLVEDLYVEVEGVIQNDSSVVATEVEFEDEDFGDDVDDVSLQGVISNYVSDADFEIDGQSIDASGAQFEPAGTMLEDGLEVEVEGDIVGSELIADEVEVREGESKLKAFVSSVNLANNSFEVSYFGGLGTVTVHVDAQTTFEDEKGALPLEDLELSDLTPLVDFVKIEGQEIINDEVNASTVKRIDDDDYKLEGAVDSWVSIGAESITVLGIIFPVDTTPITGTEFEGYANAADFFTALAAAVDPEVEIEDDVPADGVADKVELE